MEFLIVVPDEESATQRWVLEFVAEPGPSNPIPSRKLGVTSTRTADTVVEIHGRETVRISAKLKRGTNAMRFGAR